MCVCYQNNLNGPSFETEKLKGLQLASRKRY
uniref:Uncharacterized protein n=1 Tax=Anguilla anguilla TaxID=7936 RepID=A0A0E9RDV8_ANGAN